MESEIKIEGLKELTDRLTQLPDKIAKRVLARAVYAGAAVVRDEARRAVPVLTGETRRRIRVRKRRSKDKNVVLYGVVADFPAHILEFGSKPHEIEPTPPNKALGKDGRFGAKVKHPGTSAKPFMRPALDNNVRKVTDRMKEKLAEGIEKEAAKL